MMNDNGRKTRRMADRLRISGTAVIAYGIWSFLKLYMTVFFQRSVIYEEVAEYEISPSFIWLLVSLIILIAAGAILLVHVYIGWCAISESRGKRRYVYLIIAGMMLMGTLTGFFAEDDSEMFFSGLDSRYAHILLDVTLIYILADMIIASIRLKRLRKKEVR